MTDLAGEPSQPPDPPGGRNLRPVPVRSTGRTLGCDGDGGRWTALGVLTRWTEMVDGGC